MRRRRYGRDGGKATHPILAAVGGFFVLPIVAGAATNVVSAVTKASPSNTFAIAAVAHTGGLFLWRKIAEKRSGNWHAFYRGGMYGEGFNAVVDAGLAATFSASDPSQLTTASATASTSSKAQMLDLAKKLTAGGWFKP